MLIERSFDVTDLIEQGGSNTVQVIIRPVVLGAQDHLLGSFSMGNFATEESVYIRKAPHMYGWDIMPRLVSAGLWRGVELRTLNPARFTDGFAQREFVRRFPDETAFRSIRQGESPFYVDA